MTDMLDTNVTSVVKVLSSPNRVVEVGRLSAKAKNDINAFAACKGAGTFHSASQSKEG